MQADDARRELDVPGPHETGIGHFLFQGRGRGEMADGLGQVRIGARVAGDHLADARQDPVQIKIVQPAPDAFAAGAELQDAGAAAGGEHAQHLGKGLGARRDVADAEGHGHAVHRGVGQGQLFGIGGHGHDGPGIVALELVQAALEHGRAEIHGGHLHLREAAADGQRDVQGAGGQIEHAVGAAHAHVPGQHMAPVIVDAQAQRVVEQVVETGDAAEHAGDGGVMPGAGISHVRPPWARCPGGWLRRPRGTRRERPRRSCPAKPCASR